MMSEASVQDDGDDGSFISLDFSGDSLDPAAIIPLIPLRARRPVKKGDPLGSSGRAAVRRAPSGYCGFSTLEWKLKDANSNLDFLLDMIEARLALIRQVMVDQDLEWEAVFFDGPSAGQKFSDLRPELLERARRIGLPLTPKGYEAATFVMDVSQCGTKIDPADSGHEATDNTGEVKSMASGGSPPDGKSE